MIGEKIRSIRIQKKLTLTELAKRIGVAASFISQVERGISNPSIKSLRAIAKVLNVPIFYFLMNDKEELRIVRKDKRKKLKLPHSNEIYELLTPNLKDKKMEVILMTILPHSSKKREFYSHISDENGEECAVVLKGEARVEIASDKYILKEGDSIYFNCGLPHRFLCNNKEKVTIISIISPPSF